MRREPTTRRSAPPSIVFAGRTISFNRIGKFGRTGERGRVSAPATITGAFTRPARRNRSGRRSLDVRYLRQRRRPRCAARHAAAVGRVVLLGHRLSLLQRVSGGEGGRPRRFPTDAGASLL